MDTKFLNYINKLSGMKTVREMVRTIKEVFEICEHDNEKEDVVILKGQTHVFYVSRTERADYIKHLYFTETQIDYISDNFKIAVAHL